MGQFQGKVEATDNALRRFYRGDLMKTDIDNLEEFVFEWRNNPKRHTSTMFYHFIRAVEDFIDEQTSLTASRLNRMRHLTYNWGGRFMDYTPE